MNIWRGSTVWRAIQGFGGLERNPLIITMIAWLLVAPQHTFSRHAVVGYPPSSHQRHGSPFITIFLGARRISSLTPSS